MGSTQLLHFVVILLLFGDFMGANVGELVNCIDGERSLLQEPLTDTTYTIFTYVRRETDRRRARHCVWEIQPPEGQSGTLLLQLRHKTRPVAAGVDFMPNLTCTLHQRGTTKSVQFQWNYTVFKSIWMNWTDKLELRFAVDNTSAMDDSLHLFASFATKDSCSDSSQLNYNGTCYMVYRPSNDSNSSSTSSSKDQVFNSAIPPELAAGFKTVDELLEFSRQELKLLKEPVLLIPGIRVSCNGTQLLHLITTDAAECKWSPMDGNISGVIQWSANLTQSGCHFLTLHAPTELGKRHTFGCVSSDEASQLPQLLAVSSSERRPLDGPQLPADINGCRDSIIDSCQPHVHVPDSDTPNKSFVIPLVVVFAVLLSVALIIALPLGICVWRKRRARSPGSAANGDTRVQNCDSGSANGHGTGGAEEQVPLRQGP